MTASPAISPEAPGSIPEWLWDFYDHTYLETLGHLVPEDRTKAECDLIESLFPGRQAALLDLCCGGGRHLSELQTRGYTQLAGVDINTDFLDVAHCHLGETVSLHQEDAANLPFDSEFDGIYCYHSVLASFEPATVVQILQSAARGLRPGGHLLIENVNPTILYAQPHDQWVLSTDPLVVECVEWDLLASKITLHRNMVSKNGLEKRTHTARIYHLHELVEMTRQAGLIPEVVWGDVHGGGYNRFSPQLILWARRPGEPLKMVNDD